MSSNKNSDIGTKLMNELMVDIIGAVIPGLLFIIVIAISIGVPCCIYMGPNLVDKLVELLRGSGWWVLLIISIIFSYVIGQIFYRADITVPDGKDVKRQVKEFVKKTVKQKLENKELNALINRQIDVLYNRFENCTNPYLLKTFSTLYKACQDCKQKGNYNNINDKSNLFGVLFPEDCEISGDHINYNSSNESKEVYLTYEKLIRKYDDGHYADKETMFLLTCYCILYCQMDFGCATEKRCEFPYLNYYKYLLKRNLTNLLKYVDWHTVEGRTKNKINSLKIKIQIFASEAYALINKNESHVRMSSSTWHISKLLIWITGITFCLLTLIEFVPVIWNKDTPRQKTSIVVQNNDNGSNLSNTYQYHIDYKPSLVNKCVAILTPLLMLLLVIYLKIMITKFIHYQRMREIQYTLQIYEQCEEIIKYRQNISSNTSPTQHSTTK